MCILLRFSPYKKKNCQTLETLEGVIEVPRRVADAIVILSDLNSAANDFMEMRKVFNSSRSDLLRFKGGRYRSCVYISRKRFRSITSQVPLLPRHELLFFSLLPISSPSPSLLGPMTPARGIARRAPRIIIKECSPRREGIVLAKLPQTTLKKQLLVFAPGRVTFSSLSIHRKETRERRTL